MGPSGRPSVLSRPWTSMEVSYRVRVSEKGTEQRTFRIDDVAALEAGRSKVATGEVGPNNLGVSGQITIQTTDGEKWLGALVFEDRFDLCLASDPYYSYTVLLRTNAFYEWLRRLCLSHLRQEHAHAQIEHVILRTNLDIQAYDVLTDP